MLNTVSFFWAPIADMVERAAGRTNPVAYDLGQACFDVAYRPHIVDLFKRVNPYYNSRDKHIEKVVHDFVYSSPHDALFKLLPPKP
jgi:hypothetical protein